MLQKLIDDLTGGLRKAVGLAAVSMALVVTGLLTICFLCAALFVYALQTYGLLQACLGGAALFLIVSVVLVIILAASRTRKKPVVKPPAKSTVHTMVTDPMVLTAGLQVARVLGMRRLITLVALGGVALGLLATKSKTSASDAG